MDSKLDQAREWVEDVGKIEGLMPGPRAAAEVIQSLPDQWIDAEKLREVIEEYDSWESGALIDDLRALLTPPLQTLADLIEAGNDPQNYQWMQCNVEGRGDGTFMIAVVGERFNKVLLPDGRHEVISNDQVTPLPDEPTLVWPGSHADTITAESVEDVQAGRVADFEPALPCPEDVPAGEPWIVRYEGEEWVGVRANEDRFSWSIIRMDGLDYRDADDIEIGLVSRLVPEHKENA